jgi:hypothetical protein
MTLRAGSAGLAAHGERRLAHVKGPALARTAKSDHGTMGASRCAPAAQKAVSGQRRGIHASGAIE